MVPSLIAAGLIVSLRPILRNTAHQLTLLGLVTDEFEFEATWMGINGSYHGLGGMSLIQLADIVRSVEFGLACRPACIISNGRMRYRIGIDGKPVFASARLDYSWFVCVVGSEKAAGKTRCSTNKLI